MTRELVLECASKLIGNYGKGSPQVYAIWRQVLPAHLSNAQVKQFADKQEWCGGSALCAYQNAGLTKAPWTIGLGFKDALGLEVVPWPKPGDLAIQDHKPYHHMIVEYWNHENDWGDLAGNTPFYARHRHASSKGIKFYSIEPLLGENREGKNPPARTPTLRLGSQGPDVKLLQGMLVRAGYPALKTDGSFGPVTANVVMQFQRRNGLQPDAIVGQLTWAALGRVVSDGT